LENPGVDGMIILKWFFTKWGRDMDWIELAQDINIWQALVKEVMKFRVTQNARNFLNS
jgi:hypothetical protein